MKIVGVLHGKMMEILGVFHGNIGEVGGGGGSSLRL